MAKLTLQGCGHRVTRSWGDELHATCMICYERLRQLGTSTGRADRHWISDTPAPLCEHKYKETIEKAAKYKHGEYIDALCMDCGVVLRHPEGPGGWEEVVHNGFVIKEEP